MRVSKWEYRIVWIYSESDLNIAGQQGWEAVGITYENMHGPWKVLLKRQIMSLGQEIELA